LLSIQRTPNGKGAIIDPPSSNNLSIKFAFDGGRITTNRNNQQEIGTLDILTDRSVSEVKSHNNAVQWVIMLGMESRDLFEDQLADVVGKINALNT